MQLKHVLNQLECQKLENTAFKFRTEINLHSSMQKSDTYSLSHIPHQDSVLQFLLCNIMEDKSLLNHAFKITRKIGASIT